MTICDYNKNQVWILPRYEEINKYETSATDPRKPQKVEK